MEASLGPSALVRSHLKHLHHALSLASCCSDVEQEAKVRLDGTVSEVAFAGLSVLVAQSHAAYRGTRLLFRRQEEQVPCALVSGEATEASFAFAAAAAGAACGVQQWCSWPIRVQSGCVCPAHVVVDLDSCLDLRSHCPWGKRPIG